MNPAIVIVAFNRPRNLEKLLSGINLASYETRNISLVISIDYQDSPEHKEVVDIAQGFEWNFGPKRLIVHEQNIGLRDHILSCGDLTKDYDGVILLEDDLRVSPCFYQYAKAAATYYDANSQVGGISLYAYEYEEIRWYRFYPNYLGYDSYFLQWAASWGQLWTRRQWKGFREWFKLDYDFESANIPMNVKRWKRSWKKYYIAYLVEQGKFFVYPYVSFTTLKDEKGDHRDNDSRVNHVLIAGNIDRPFYFATLERDDLKYDAFYQPINRLVYVPAINDTVEVEFDLFGTKPLTQVTAPYLLSVKKSTEPIKQFSNKLLPYEHNLLQHEEGDHFTLALTETFNQHATKLYNAEKLYSTRKVYEVKQMLEIFLYKVFKRYIRSN